MTDYLAPGVFFGDRLSTWETGAFTLSESVYLPGTVLRQHAHSRAYVTLVVNGAHREIAGRTERECTPATVVFHPRGEVHANTFSRDGGRIFRLEVSNDWIACHQDWSTFAEHPMACHRGRLSQIGMRMLAEFRTRDFASRLIIEALTLEFAGGAVREGCIVSQSRPVWIRTAVAYLHEHLDADIRLSDLARAANVHPTHLNRGFKRWYGCSVGEYLRRIRVERAAQDLLHSKRTLAEIALSLGFADQSHFSRVFTRVMGTTPGRYRRLLNLKTAK